MESNASPEGFTNPRQHFLDGDGGVREVIAGDQNLISSVALESRTHDPVAFKQARDDGRSKHPGEVHRGLAQLVVVDGANRRSPAGQHAVVDGVAAQFRARLVVRELRVHRRRVDVLIKDPVVPVVRQLAEGSGRACVDVVCTGERDIVERGVNQRSTAKVRCRDGLQFDLGRTGVTGCADDGAVSHDDDTVGVEAARRA